MKKTLSAFILGFPAVASAHPGHEHVVNSTTHHLAEAGWVVGIGIAIVVGFSIARSYFRSRS